MLNQQPDKKPIFIIFEPTFATNFYKIEVPYNKMFH
jgi:hypothetical protein